MRFNHAIVIGGSITGLLSARILAKYFTSVTIVEIDRLPENPDSRKGVPQSAQPHILFAKGYRILEELFPGIGTDLLQAGAMTIDWAREFHHFDCGKWNAIASSPSEIVSFSCSRPLLEWSIRRRVRELVNIRFVEQQQVVGLLCNARQTQVTGVRLSSKSEASKDEMLADLVVDTSGRRSQAPRWLQDIGFPAPPETVVDPLLGYATCRFKEPSGFEANWKVMLISQSPPSNTRLGYLARIEGKQWIATLGGYGHDFPPLDLDNFLGFARSLASPKFYEALADAELISSIYPYRATTNRLRHYHKIKLPDSFVCLGDTVCALCPVYGQGMTVSALSVMVLDKWLEQYSNTPIKSSDFQKRLAKEIFSSWFLATRQDSLFPTTKGRRKPELLNKLIRWYANRLLIKSSSDANVHTTLMGVANLVTSPLTLYQPGFILRAFGSFQINSKRF